MNKSKRTLVSIVLSIIIILSTLLYLSFYLRNSGFTDVVTLKNKEETNIAVQHWIEAKTSNRGIHVLSNNRKSEYLILYNKNEGKNLYINPTITIKSNKGVMSINIQDTLATNDQYVKDVVLSFVQVDPLLQSEIKVFLNNELEENVMIETMNLERLLN